MLGVPSALWEKAAGHCPGGRAAKAVRLRWKLLLFAALLGGAQTGIWAQASLESGSVLAAAERLKAGEFLWAPEVAPEGPVLVVVSLATQRAVLMGDFSGSPAPYDNGYGVHDAQVVERELILLEHAQLRRARDRPPLRGQLAGEQLHERRFPGAVRTGQAIPPAFGKRRGDVFEEDLVAEAHGDVLYGDHNQPLYSARPRLSSVWPKNLSGLGLEGPAQGGKVRHGGDHGE